MPIILQCRDLEKRFQHRGGFVAALTGATATFSAGEWVGIKGYSGSGKSTLLNLLTGLDTPSAGDVKFLEHSFHDMGTNGLCRLRRKWVGIVLQEFALVAHLTAQENVELPGLLSGRSPSELRKRSNELLQSIRLDHRRDHYPSELSGGERQRVAIARALMVEDAKVLVADEPTSNVDSRSANEIAAIFKGLAEQGLCVITASHDDRLLQAADRILHIEDGRLTGGELDA